MIGNRYTLRRLTNKQISDIKDAGRRPLDCNIEDMLKSHGNASIWEVKKVDPDCTAFVQLVGVTTRICTWVDIGALSAEPVMTETNLIGKGVSKVRVTNYIFENQVYNDKQQVLGILLARVPQLTSSNFNEVMASLKEIESTWNKM